MANLINRLFGLLQPGATFIDTPAAPTPPMQIAGARAASQLCMLPIDGIDEKGNPHIAITRHLHLVQYKADGIRALYIDGRIVSREGAPLDCALHCQPGLDRIVEKAGLGPLVFDGEYVADGGFNATLAEHKSGKGEGVFWAFDFMPLADWQAGRCDVPVEGRAAMLRRLLIQHGDSLFIGMLDYWIMNRDGMIAKAREIWAAGGEGIVAKRIGSPYVRDRSDDWVRIKETITVDGQIADLMAHGGAKAGQLKHMTVRVMVGDAPRIIVVGTGWTEAEGRALLHNNGAAIGSWVEISFQLTTGLKRSVRGARFHRVRADKGARA